MRPGTLYVLTEALIGAGRAILPVAPASLRPRGDRLPRRARARARRRGLQLALVALALALLVAGCSANRYAKPRTRPGDGVERGVASWYGKKFHGRPTASGEIYDMHALTAAHRELPLGTWVEVRHLGNGRTVRVKVNDRGPFIKGRFLDLSYGAARELDMIVEGVAEVEMRILDLAPMPDLEARFTVQVGSFRDRDNALALKLQLERDHSHVAVHAAHGWHRVQVGRFDRRADAETLRRRLARRLGLTAVVVGLR